MVSYKTVNNGTAGLIITLTYKENTNFYQNYSLKGQNIGPHVKFS